MNSCACCTLAAALVLLLVASSSAQQQFYASGRYGKRAEMSLGNVHEESRSVVGGHRYGRQPPVDVQVAPRTDRFYTGSRYGKRAERADVATDERMSKDSASAEQDLKVTCVYTGVTNLYRCFDRKDNPSEQTAAAQSN